ncbi:MAG TPA: phospholipase D-like domain-containing protein [Methanocella sp.]|nr:phospholipase D-like domain-containing protein [Methanocella sp.]
MKSDRLLLSAGVRAIICPFSVSTSAGDHLMHSKYIIRDGRSPSVTVWMGSANFTTNAWSIQDNNIVIPESPDLATKYETDFTELWEAGLIAGTGKDEQGESDIDGVDVEVDFSPGDGPTMDQSVANQISSANSEIARSDCHIFRDGAERLGRSGGTRRRDLRRLPRPGNGHGTQKL